MMPSYKLVYDVDAALAGVQRHSYSLGDKSLALYASALVDRKAALCYFHAT